MVDQIRETPISEGFLPGGARTDESLNGSVEGAEELLLTQERMRGLVDAVVSIAEDLSLDAVLKRVVESACRLLRAQYGALGVIAQDQTLSHFITVGIDDQTVQKIGRCRWARVCWAC